MENYIVSARKYRPATFRDVVGQHALTVTLKNAIATDRLAHAYLFCGSRGVGKTSCARIFAKTINCTHRTPEGEACNECDSCRQFNENRSLNIIELDAASHNGIDDMKSLIEQVMVPPTEGRYRVFIIDEVHMLTSAAFNAFLKTLEEPPHYVIFILATTEKHKIIPTILSRCQIYDFNRIGVQDIIDHLQYVASREGYQAETPALGVIAERADGAMRDALSIFDQVAASSMGNITYQAALDSLGVLDKSYYARLVDAFLAGDVRQALLLFNDIRQQGFDAQTFVNGLGQYMRDLMVAADPSTLRLLEAGDSVKAEMAQRAALCTPDFLYKAMAICNQADLDYRTATNKQFLVELTLIRLCQLLSPSPDNSGSDEGQLKPIAVANPAPAPVDAAPAPAPTPQPSQPSRLEVKTAQVSQPQAQTPSAPAGMPPPPAPAPQPNREMRRPTIGGTINIHAVKSEPMAATHAAAAAVQRREQPYTPEQLEAAWDAFILENPQEVLVINTMRTSRPEATDVPHAYNMRLENAIQGEMMGEHFDSINKFLRDRLANDAVTVTPYINEGAAPARAWCDREHVAYLLENSKAFATFVEDFKLKLI